MNNTDTLKTRKAETLHQKQRIAKPHIYLADTILLFGNEWHDFTVSAGPQIPRGDVNSLISRFLFWICLEANSHSGEDTRMTAQILQ